MTEAPDWLPDNTSFCLISNKEEFYVIARRIYAICKLECCNPANPNNELKGYPVATCQRCGHKHGVD